MSGGVLLLAQYFPPRPAAAARRLRQLAEAALRDYDRVYVIRGDRAYAGEELPGVEVSVIPLRDLRTVAGGKGPAGTIPAGGRRPGLLSGLRRLRQAVPFVWWTDDGGPAYRAAAYREAVRLIESERITTIISSFRPWSDHLVARRLKRRYPALRWVADFRDLPVDPVRRDVWWPALQRWWARRVVASADVVWAVSRGQADQLSNLHPKVVVRRSRLDRLPPAETAPVSDRFTIVYTGSLYPGLQSVRPLVRALSDHLAAGRMAAGRLRLEYVGKDDRLWAEWTAELPEEVRRITAPLPPAEARERQRQAQVLLLLNWTAPGYYGVLTAKLWDYLAAGRPILALVNGPPDPELAGIISGADAGAVFAEGEQGAVADWLLAAYTRWAVANTLPWHPRTDALKAYL